MALDPRQLEAFLAVVNTGSLSRGAEQLNVTQPALSKIIKRLESRLGAQLFERHAAGMELTMFGEALLPYAIFLDSESRHAIHQINALRGLDSGLLRIGTLVSVAVSILPAIVMRINARHPNLKIEIVQDMQDGLANLLRTNKLDVVIADEIQDTDNIVNIGKQDFSDAHVPIAANNHPLAQRESIDLKDVEGAIWVGPKSDMRPRRQFEELFKNHGLRTPNVHVECNQPSTVMAIVMQTQLLGWLPAPMVEPEVKAKRLVTLDIPELVMERTFYVYRRERSFVSPQIHSFVNALSG